MIRVCIFLELEKSSQDFSTSILKMWSLLFLYPQKVGTNFADKRMSLCQFARGLRPRSLVVVFSPWHFALLAGRDFICCRYKHIMFLKKINVIEDVILQGYCVP
jgi:hypothetical protein